MPLLNQLRLLTNKALAPAGFAVNRVRKSNPFGSPLITARVGRFSIQVPRASQMATLYLDNPDYMSQLKALASVLIKKYPGLSAIDVGANVGDTACVIKSVVDIPLVCIEGDDYTFGLLEANVRQFQNVTAHKVFLGAATGSMSASFEKVGWNTTIKPGDSAHAQTIKIVSLDDFLSAHPAPKNCKLLKIDAEGFDCSIIRGAGNFIRQTHPVLAFEYNRDNMTAIGEKGDAALALLQEAGYARVAFHDCNGRFFTAATLSDAPLIQDLLSYADGRDGLIYYFDLTLFHADDDDLALEFIDAERRRRPGAQ